MTLAEGLCFDGAGQVGAEYSEELSQRISLGGTVEPVP